MRWTTSGVGGRAALLARRCSAPRRSAEATAPRRTRTERRTQRVTSARRSPTRRPGRPSRSSCRRGQATEESHRSGGSSPDPARSPRELLPAEDARRRRGPGPSGPTPTRAGRRLRALGCHPSAHTVLVTHSHRTTGGAGGCTSSTGPAWSPTRRSAPRSTASPPPSRTTSSSSRTAPTTRVGACSRRCSSARATSRRSPPDRPRGAATGCAPGPRSSPTCGPGTRSPSRACCRCTRRTACRTSSACSWGAGSGPSCTPPATPATTSACSTRSRARCCRATTSCRRSPRTSRASHGLRCPSQFFGCAAAAIEGVHGAAGARPALEDLEGRIEDIIEHHDRRLAAARRRGSLGGDRHQYSRRLFRSARGADGRVRDLPSSTRGAGGWSPGATTTASCARPA